jgi:D-alanine-D-alanine ligase
VSQDIEIVVLCGALSPERAVSLRSGAACAEALAKTFPNVRLVTLDENTLPAGLDPAKHVIFPVIHGDYGEDGRLQTELESRGFAYAGCDPEASALCIDKVATKRRVREAGVPVTADVRFAAESRPGALSVVRRLGREVVMKPADKGSSVGLHMLSGARSLGRVLGRIREGNWMIEPRLRGRELTVGLLDGKAMGIVEIAPKSGDYDYKSKYTAGATQYLFPAPIPEETAAAIRTEAEKFFAACGCRDYARADVILLPSGKFRFLEINTIPGLTATSLLPKSASCVGIDFPALTRRMIEPALRRRESRANKPA